MYQNIYIERIKGDVFETNQTIVHLWDDKTGYQTFEFENYAYRLNPGGDYKTLFGDSVSKIKSWSKWDVEAGKIFESDIPIETRVFVDLYNDSDDSSEGHRLLIFDIEVDSSEGYPNIQNADKAITAISCYDDISNEFFVFILDKSLLQKS